MRAAPALRTVLITGAATRLGRGMALALATAGWQVAVHYRGSQEAALQTVADCNARLDGAGRCAALQADLGDEVATRALVPQVVAQLGALDAVVNNASMFEHDTIASIGYEALAAHLRANTGAPVLLAQALHAHVSERDAQGAVVNLLDQKLWNPNPDFFSYTLSKAALEAAGTLLAMALAPRVRVVGVAPGLTLTSHLMPPEKFEQLHRLAPLGHSSTLEDVVATVKFALENQSLTGTTLLVDGGQHLMKFERDFSLM